MTRQISLNVVNHILSRHVQNMMPRERVWLARHLLNSVDEFSYSEFESAQAVGRYVKKARNALKGLNLG